MNITPINMAEAIVEPFWDPRLSGLARWRIEPNEAAKLQVKQNWCWVAFEWNDARTSEQVLRMSRDCELDCRGYDRLILSVMAPEHAIVEVVAHTDRGDMRMRSERFADQKRELELPLQGAASIASIGIAIEAGCEGAANGWFNWIGLQNEALLSRHLAQYARFDERWEGYLQPESYEPSFRPAYGLMANVEELAAIREQFGDRLRSEAGSRSALVRGAVEAAAMEPEAMISDFVNFWNDTRYCRERDRGKELLNGGTNAAVAGLLLKDKQALRLAARYALSLAMCDHWDDGMICKFPGSTFEHRCFVQSLAVYDVALLLDLAGDLFTDLGRDYLLRRIAEEGIGTIQYNVWRHEYIFHCNQLIWFTAGRILGLAAMAHSMPRVRPALDQAYRDLLESLAHSFLPDGGYVEGPTYFSFVARQIGVSLYIYSRAVGIPFADIVPEAIRQTGDFAEALLSLDESTDFIPICDAWPGEPWSSWKNWYQEGLALLASWMPDSHWVTMFRRSFARSGGVPTTLLGCKLEPGIPQTGPAFRPFVYLPDMGILSSVRSIGAERVKLLIMGNKAGAGHTHQDKGSFVLEFAGETFAADPGTCDYSSPLAEELKHAERHNMLIPYGISGRPARPQSPLPHDVKPDGRGDETQLHVRIDATPGWEGFYRKWVREWESASPEQLIVRDDYELADGNGVELLLQTQRQVRVEGATVELIGERGIVTVEAAAGCTIRVDELPFVDNATYSRIAIRREGRAGQLATTFRFRLRS